MAEKLVFEYDKAGDILYVTTVQPYAEQASEELEDEVVARLNPTTGAVEGLEILFFSKRMADKKLFELPVTGDLHLV